MRPKLPAIEVSGGHLVLVICEPAAAAASQLIDRIAGQVGPPDVLVNAIGAFRPETRLLRLPRCCGS